MADFNCLGFQTKKPRNINNQRQSSTMENCLPISIIHHIQSFLTDEEASQTRFISDSWNHAWLTRPRLCFNQMHFPAWPFSLFLDSVRRTVKRYEDLNLNIYSFELSLIYRFSHSATSTDALVKRALKLCAGAEFNLKSRDINYVLPSEVLQAETIVKLSLLCCQISRPVGENVNLNSSKLSSVRLEHTKIYDDLFWDKFPCLEDLTLLNCTGYRFLQISSTSIKCISIIDNMSFRARFNVGNIQKFMFSGTSIPSLFLDKDSSMKWEYDISLKCHHVDHAPRWFYKINKLKTWSLSMCKVSLSLRFSRPKCVCRGLWNFSGMKSNLGNLTMSFPLSFVGNDEFFNWSFAICRPKFVSQSWFPEKASYEEAKVSNELMKHLCRRLIQDRKENFYLTSLEEVEVEAFHETDAEWKSFPWKRFLDGSHVPSEKTRVRFQLKWRDL